MHKFITRAHVTSVASFDSYLFGSRKQLSFYHFTLPPSLPPSLLPSHRPSLFPLPPPSPAPWEGRANAHLKI